VALSPAQQRLAAVLRQLRARSGMSAVELGRLLGWTQTRVSRAENGGRRVSVAETVVWADATNAPDDLRAEALGLAESAARDVRSWWTAHAGGLAGRQREIAALEASAEVIRNCQLMIPGLLQTAEYARHALTLANVSGQSDVAAAVATRMRRQEILFDQSKSFEYVLPESALSFRLTDDPAVARAQADRLLSVDTLANVSIGIVPTTVPAPILPAAFTLYEIPGGPVVVVETLTHEVVMGDERDVVLYREAFARLREVSVTSDEAHRLIRASAGS
jgi:transcriptional regulator with XRE-family HTH domain